MPSTNYLQDIYAETELIIKDAQPHYILPRDTVKAFLHEKKKLLGIRNKTLGLLGIEISLLICLSTADFHDVFSISSSVIQGTFIAFFLILGVLLVQYAKTWWDERKNMSVDKLTQELGSRASLIEPNLDTEFGENINLPEQDS